MAKRDSPFQSELQEFIFNPKRQLVDEARDANAPIREKLIPIGVRLLGLDLSGKLPGDLTLADDVKKTVKTVAHTFVQVTLSASAIQMSLRPGLSIDVTLMGEASLDGLRLLFGESEPRIDLRDVGFGLDPRGKIRETLLEDYGQAIRSSAFARPGYDWTRDPRLFDNLTQFYQSVSDPFTPRGAFVGNLLLDSLTVNAVALQQLRAGEEGTFVSVVPGSSITITVNFQAFLSDLIDNSKASRQALADTVVLNDIQVRCPLRLFFEGQEIGRIESVEITNDCRVFIHDFTIVQPKAAELEQTINAGAVSLSFLWNLLNETLRVSPLLTARADPAALTLRGTDVSRAQVESLATVAGAAAAGPNIVLSEIKRILEPQLTQKIGQVILENLRAIPGVDLSKVFELCKTLK